jgi:hypothetical protein
MGIRGMMQANSGFCSHIHRLPEPDRAPIDPPVEVTSDLNLGLENSRVNFGFEK